MTDPRAENCRGYDETNGKVTSVRLEHLPAPSTTYELIRATLIDEETAQGNIVATVQVLGLSTASLIVEDTPLDESYNDYTRGKVVSERRWRARYGGWRKSSLTQDKFRARMHVINAITTSR